MTISMFLLQIPNDDRDELMHVGLFSSKEAAEAYMQQFQTVSVFDCEHTHRPGVFVTVAKDEAEIMATLKDVRVLRLHPLPLAYRMIFSGIQMNFWNYYIEEIPVMG